MFASVVPLGPYTIPLFQGSLSDSPRAFLVWIPILAFGWAVWNLVSGGKTTNVQFHQRILGVPLALIAGFFLCIGRFLWPSFFLGGDIGLLIWPLWAIALLWVLFGMQSVLIVSWPMLYLVFVWPPIYNEILSVVNPTLQHIAMIAFTWMGQFAPWMYPVPHSHIVDVLWGTNQLTHVVITKACSGSDSILALLILFPVTLVMFSIKIRTKILLIVAGTLLAFIANLLRLAIIFLALHQFGFWFAFKVLHPILGTVFFLAVASGLLVIGTRKQMLETIQKEKRQFTSVKWSRTFVFLLSIFVLLALSPMYFWHTGSILRPRPISNLDLRRIVPSIYGYQLAYSNSPTHSEVLENRVYVKYVSQSGKSPLRIILFRGNRNVNRSDMFRPVLKRGDVILSRQTVIIQTGISGIMYRIYRKTSTGAGESLIQTLFQYAIVYQYHREWINVMVIRNTEPGSAGLQATFEREFGTTST